ncbi:DUF2975 domain-containing protein [Paenibacillus sediminis]|uniref:DUF2975 domain-containing protein n=1 Tax=Paenibacillus sediminis TaxID=664909 RepID=UPI0039ED1DB6
MIEIFLYLTAIPFLILLVKARKLSKNILDNNPFCESSIKSLHIISICAFTDFLLYASGTSE